jgi:hypothetical protein
MLDTRWVHVLGFQLPLYRNGKHARDGGEVGVHDQCTATFLRQADGSIVKIARFNLRVSLACILL